MTELEKIVLDLVRLGINGDSASVRQLAKRVLRRTKSDRAPDREFRKALSEVLLKDGGASRALRGAVAKEIPVDAASYLNLLRIEEEPEAMPAILSDSEEAVVSAIIDERRRLRYLLDAGIEPTRTVLLTGAPGTGKTMTARFIARKLRLPLMTLDLAAVMSSFLGKSGHNLRSSLDHARSTPCVLLVDEFDALAKRRDDPTDVGELKRIVNVLLLELESWPSHGLLVAATNHSELLDPAIWRRFDCVLELKHPALGARRAIIERTAGELGLDTEGRHTELLALATEGSTGSDLTRLVDRAARAAVLEGASDLAAQFAKVTSDTLRDRDALDDKVLAQFCAVASKDLGMSQRAIGEVVGVSHVTVGRLIRQQRATRKSRTRRHRSPG